MAVKNKHQPSESDVGYFDYAISKPGMDEGIPWYKAYPASIVRGALEGVVKLGQALGPTGTPEELQRGNAQRQEFLKENLPTGETFGTKTVERALGHAPLLASGGTSALGTALRSTGAGLLGQTAESLGFGPIGQALAEAPALLAPKGGEKIPNRVGGAAAQKENQLADFARSKGLTEKELTTTLGKNGILRDFAADFSSKGGRTVKAFDETKKALGRVWEDLRTSPEAQKSLDSAQSSSLIKDLSKSASKLPFEQRTRIKEDVTDLLKSQMRGDDIINFWQDLNYYIKKDEKGLGILKEPLKKALNQISPELGRDFELTNELYGNFSKLVGKMGPNIAESLIKSGEQGILVSAITTGNFPLLKGVLGPLGARALAREMIINPRFQNLSSRFFNAVKQGSPVAAKKIYDNIVKEVGKSNAETALKMSDFDVENFINSLESESNSQKEQ